MKPSKETGDDFVRILFRPVQFMRRTIRSRRDIEANCHFYHVGTIPKVKHIQAIAVADYSGEAVRKAFEKMIMNLRFLSARPGTQVIGIHSVKPREGKTFIAVNLAATLALNGKKTLIIDCNLRKPMVASLFGIRGDTGMSHYLEGGAFEEVVQKTSIDYLWMLPAGPVPANPAELLANGRFRTLIDRGREEVDFIILDNVPASVAGDGLLTGAACDLNLFVLRAGISCKDELRFIDQLTATGALSRLALILNEQ